MGSFGKFSAGRHGKLITSKENVKQRGADGGEEWREQIMMKRDGNRVSVNRKSVMKVLYFVSMMTKEDLYK